MSWLDSYRQASFRNVPFYVPAHSFTGGRRWSIHEIPGFNQSVIKDFGRNIRYFRIDAYVVGENYHIDRDNLIEALEQDGPGKLVHPYIGTYRVGCTSFELREQVDERRMARFSLTFIESGIAVFPKREDATSEIVQSNKSFTKSSIQSNFELVYDLTNMMFSIVSNVKDNLGTVVERIGGVRKAISSNSDYRKDYDELTADIVSLAFDATALGSSLLNLIDFGTDETYANEDYELDADNARLMYDEQRKLWESLDDTPLTTVNDNDPTHHVTALVQQMAVTSAAGLFSVMTINSWNEARELQEVLLNKIQTLADETDNDEIYENLLDLKSSVYRDFQEREDSLPRLIDYTPPITMNSLFLTYYLYGSLEREQEVIERNSIEHPGFIPGQQTIEVILDVE